MQKGLEAASKLALVTSLFVALGCAWPSKAQPSQEQGTPLNENVANQLIEAQSIAQRSLAETVYFSVDPLERVEEFGSRPMIEKLVAEGRFEDLFVLGDEAFEREMDQEMGAGRGEFPLGGVPLTQRVQNGELGGFDAGSCRSCHFSGGPDGAGTPTQLAFFRGDGKNPGSATVRDAPHVMGLGYIQLAAQRLERLLVEVANRAVQTAKSLGESVRFPFVADGIDFGEIEARPNGQLGLGAVRGVSPDLKIRPFGHKGRYSDLYSLVDDGLQLHFGVQTTQRAIDHEHQAKTHLGPGPDWDRDADGRAAEATGAHSVLLSAYLAVLPIPELRPPTHPRLQEAWARGQELMTTVGCTECHRETLLLDSYDLAVSNPMDLSVTLDLAEVGQEPIPRRLDLSPTDDDMMQRLVPIYAYTDLRRHDLGDRLADKQDEKLPGVPYKVPRGEWLTRSLWGVADTAPYLHDGRAATLEEAIEWHGGDSLEVIQNYRNLSVRDQRSLGVFLRSLTRTPTLLVE